MSSIMTAPRKVLRNRTMNTRQIPSPITITKSDGSVIVIDPTSKIVKPKRKVKVKRSARKVEPLSQRVSDQDHHAIKMQERLEEFLKNHQVKPQDYL
jgi:inhibitor of KinA sporulation pathway (predicted exonuclease)